MDQRPRARRDRTFSRRLALGLGVAAALPDIGWAAEQLDAASLARLGPEQLLDLYRRGAVTVPPAGFIRGQALVRPGTPAGPLLSRGARAVWQGKEFRPDGIAVNRFLGMPSIPGRLSVGTSWIDQGPTLVLDYRETSRVYRRYRDEIRSVGPCLMLGVMFDTEACPPRIVRYFALCP
jgi:hypothetical protein